MNQNRPKSRIEELIEFSGSTSQVDALSHVCAKAISPNPPQDIMEQFGSRLIELFSPETQAEYRDVIGNGSHAINAIRADVSRELSEVLGFVAAVELQDKAAQLETFRRIHTSIEQRKEVNRGHVKVFLSGAKEVSEEKEVVQTIYGEWERVFNNPEEEPELLLRYMRMIVRKGLNSNGHGVKVSEEEIFSRIEEEMAVEHVSGHHVLSTMIYLIAHVLKQSVNQQWALLSEELRECNDPERIKVYRDSLNEMRGANDKDDREKKFRALAQEFLSTEVRQVAFQFFSDDIEEFRASFKEKSLPHPRLQDVVASSNISKKDLACAIKTANLRLKTLELQGIEMPEETIISALEATEPKAPTVDETLPAPKPTTPYTITFNTPEALESEAFDRALFGPFIAYNAHRLKSRERGDLLKILERLSQDPTDDDTLDGLWELVWNMVPSSEVDEVNTYISAEESALKERNYYGELFRAIEDHALSAEDYQELFHQFRHFLAFPAFGVTGRILTAIGARHLDVFRRMASSCEEAQVIVEMATKLKLNPKDTAAIGKIRRWIKNGRPKNLIDEIETIKRNPERLFTQRTPLLVQAQPYAELQVVFEYKQNPREIADAILEVFAEMKVEPPVVRSPQPSTEPVFNPDDGFDLIQTEGIEALSPLENYQESPSTECAHIREVVTSFYRSKTKALKKLQSQLSTTAKDPSEKNRESLFGLLSTYIPKFLRSEADKKRGSGVAYLAKNAETEEVRGTLWAEVFNGIEDDTLSPEFYAYLRAIAARILQQRNKKGDPHKLTAVYDERHQQVFEDYISGITDLEGLNALHATLKELRVTRKKVFAQKITDSLHELMPEYWAEHYTDLLEQPQAKLITVETKTDHAILIHAELFVLLQQGLLSDDEYRALEDFCFERKKAEEEKEKQKAAEAERKRQEEAARIAKEDEARRAEAKRKREEEEAARKLKEEKEEERRIQQEQALKEIIEARVAQENAKRIARIRQFYTDYEAISTLPEYDIPTRKYSRPEKRLSDSVNALSEKNFLVKSDIDEANYLGELLGSLKAPHHEVVAQYCDFIAKIQAEGFKFKGDIEKHIIKESADILSEIVTDVSIEEAPLKVLLSIFKCAVVYGYEDRKLTEIAFRLVGQANKIPDKEKPHLYAAIVSYPGEESTPLLEELIQKIPLAIIGNELKQAIKFAPRWRPQRETLLRFFDEVETLKQSKIAKHAMLRLFRAAVYFDLEEYKELWTSRVRQYRFVIDRNTPVTKEEEKAANLVKRFYKGTNVQCGTNILFYGIECDLLIEYPDGGLINIESDGSLHQENSRRQITRDEILEKLGVRTIRLSNGQINTITEQSVQAQARFLKGFLPRK